MGDGLLKEVSRRRYAALIRKIPHEWSRPTVGKEISVMQFVCPLRQRLLAQATYYHGASPRYQANEDLIEEAVERHRRENAERSGV